MMCGWSTRPRSSAGVRGETAQRSDLAGWAEDGYCASHSRFFWGLRLHLVCTLSGLPVAFALAGAKADERDVLLAMFEADPNLVAARPKQKLMADKNYHGKAFEAALADADLELLRPARKGENPRPATPLLQAVPARSSSTINNTLKTQLDLERHGGAHHRRGVASRSNATHLLALITCSRDLATTTQLGRPTATFANRLRSLNLGITHLVGIGRDKIDTGKESDDC